MLCCALHDVLFSLPPLEFPVYPILLLNMNVLLVDDSRLARTELRHLLQAFSDVTVVGEARHAEEARAQIQALRPDLLLLDV